MHSKINTPRAGSSRRPKPTCKHRPGGSFNSAGWANLAAEHGSYVQFALRSPAQQSHARASQSRPLTERPGESHAPFTLNLGATMPCADLEAGALTVRHKGIVYPARIDKTRRPSGRRIRVWDHNDRLLFDSLDCFDLGNALFKLDEWLNAS